MSAQASKPLATANSSKARSSKLQEEQEEEQQQQQTVQTGTDAVQDENQGHYIKIERLEVVSFVWFL
jgi:hypothetical protein